MDFVIMAPCHEHCTTETCEYDPSCDCNINCVKTDCFEHCHY